MLPSLSTMVAKLKITLDKQGRRETVEQIQEVRLGRLSKLKFNYKNGKQMIKDLIYE